MKKANLRGATIALMIFILVISLAYYGAYYNKLAYPVKDYGCLLSGGARVSSGQMPYINFFSYYPPLRYLVLGGWFKMLGVSVESSQLLLAFLLTLSNLLLFLVACRFLPRILALIPVIIHLIMPGPWWKVWFMLSVLTGLLFILRYIERPDKLRASLAGFACGIMIWIRQDIGCYLLLTLAVIFVITYLKKTPLRNFIYCVSGGIASGMTFIFYYMLRGGNIVDFFRDTLWTVYITRQAAGDAARFWVYPNTLFGIAGILFMFIFAFIIYKRREDMTLFTRLCALLIMTGFCFFHMQIGSFKYYRFPQDQALMYIIMVFIGLETYRLMAGKTNKMLVRVSSSLVLVFIISGISFYSYYTFFALSKSGYFAYTGILPYFKKNWQKTNIERMGNVMIKREKAMAFKNAIKAIDSAAEVNEDVFYGSNAFLAFLSAHPTPAREDVVYFLFADKSVMRDFLERAKEKAPKVVVLSAVDRRIARRNPEENIRPVLDFVKNNYDFSEKVGRYYVFVKAENPDRIETEKRLNSLFFGGGKKEKSARAKHDYE